MYAAFFAFAKRTEPSTLPRGWQPQPGPVLPAKQKNWNIFYITKNGNSLFWIYFKLDSTRKNFTQFKRRRKKKKKKLDPFQLKNNYSPKATCPPRLISVHFCSPKHNLCVCDVATTFLKLRYVLSTYLHSMLKAHLRIGSVVQWRADSGGSRKFRPGSSPDPKYGHYTISCYVIPPPPLPSAHWLLLSVLYSTLCPAIHVQVFELDNKYV